MKLYLVHCGFYDLELCGGIYEGHANFFVAAESFEDARAKAKLIDEFKQRKMHVDGVQEIQVVNGHRVELHENPELTGQTLVTSQRHRDLAPRRPELPELQEPLPN